MPRCDPGGDPVRSVLHRLCWLVFLLGGLTLQGSGESRASLARAGNLSPKNFEVLGVSLPESTVSEVERILGRAPSKQGDNVEETYSCYISPGNDRTVLEFEYWFENVVEFRLFTRNPQTVNQCVKSKLISAGLATASGLRLGLTEVEVVKILGPPLKKQSNSFTYEVSYNRPLTSKEIRRFKDANQPEPASIFVYGKIDLRFRQGKLDWIDIARGYDF